VKLLPRRSTAPTQPEVEVESVATPPGAAPKGRPTPKRRDSAPRRAAVTQPPRNRKEAYRWQKQQTQKARAADGKAMTKQSYRAALASGDESVLPRRDQGPLRKLARNWVDSRRMLSNYLLLLFPLMIIGAAIPYVTMVVVALFVVFVGEWYLTGRNITALARERHIEVNSGPMGLGFYAGSRAYMPRRWRMPKPQVQLGDQI
jgi:hypothetical protein